MHHTAFLSIATPAAPEELKWARFQGLEHPYSFMHVSGHPGAPPLVVYLFALLMAIIIGACVYHGQRKINGIQGLRPWIRLAAGAWLVISFFVLLEASLAIFVFFFPYQLYIPDPVAFWRANPGLAASTGHYDRHMASAVNEPSFFDREFVPEKRAGTIRIVCLGDSQTMGFPWVDSAKQSYPKVLQALLRKRLPDRQMEVINGGISGYTSFQGLFALKHIALRYSPDIVLISYCYHDGNESYAEDREVLTDSESEIALKRLLYRSQLYLMIRKIIYRGKARNFDKTHKPVVMRVSLVDYEKNLRQMISLARAHKVRPVFVNLPIEDADDHSAAHRLVMSKVAQSEGIPFIDANAAFHALSRDKREGFFFDGVHYTVYGNRAVAEMLASRIMPMLGSTRSQRGVRFESAAGRGN